MTPAAYWTSSVAPSEMASAKPRIGREGGAQVVGDRHQELPLRSLGLGQAVGHLVDRVGQGHQLVALPLGDRDPGLQVARGNSTGHPFGLQKGPGDATTEPDGGDEGDDDRRRRSDGEP